MIKLNLQAIYGEKPFSSFPPAAEKLMLEMKGKKILAGNS